MAEGRRGHMTVTRHFPTVFASVKAPLLAGGSALGRAGSEKKKTTMSCFYKPHGWGTYMAVSYNNTHAPRM